MIFIHLFKWFPIVLLRQVEEYKVYGVSLNGSLTCGENVADLGGLKLAYRWNIYYAHQKRH